MTDARDELLTKVVDEVAAHGLADRSLRDIAAATGTSHRMLLYHFGSREGLVAAIVASVEASQRELARSMAGEGGTATDLVRRQWAVVSSPELRPFVRLFFETTAYAGRTAPGTDLTGPWLDDTRSVAEAVGIDHDPVEIRLGIAVIRGLLIDVVTTGDVDAATASLDRFLEMWAHWRDRAADGQRPSKRGGRPSR